MTPRVGIVTVNFNGLDDTRKCLDSLAALTSPATVFVVDNASTDDPTARLKDEFPWAHVVRNRVNAGWSGGNNMGIRLARDRGADFIILLNNDTTVHPDLVGRLLTAAGSHPEFGILGPIIRFMDEPEHIMTDGTRFNRPGYPGFFERQPVAEREANPPAVVETDIVNGCCMMIRAAVFDRIGLIDDRFFLIHEEADFCLRTRRAGWNCGLVAEGLVWHKGSSAFKNSGQRWQRYYDTRNLGLLLAKHQASLRTGRGGLASYGHYLRYAYHRYCHEREAGQDDAAEAVLEGLFDAATRHFGAYQPRSRWGVPVLRCLFESARKLKASLPSPRRGEGGSRSEPGEGS